LLDQQQASTPIRITVSPDAACARTAGNGYSLCASFGIILTGRPHNVTYRTARGVMTKRKILVITPCPTHPAEQGNNRRIGNLIASLSRLGHDTHVLYVPHFMLGLPDLRAMRERWNDRLHVGRPHWAGVPGPLRMRVLWMREHALARFHPKSATNFDRLVRSEWERRTRDLWERYRFDAVIVEYVLISKLLCSVPDSVSKIIDTIDVFGDRNQRVQNVPKRKRWFSTTREEESAALERAHVVLAIQEEEAEYFRSLGHDRVITVGHLADRVHAAGEPAGAPSIMVMGSESASNRHGLSVFLSRAWPLVRARVPDARLRVIGRIGDAMMNGTPGVERLGVVADTAMAYESGHVVINPVLEGTGLPIKSIEALMFGKPLVATPWAARSLQDGAGSAFVASENPEEMAAAVITLLTDTAARKDVATAALRYAERYVERQTRNLELALAARSAG
jgi:glycosyltransferase involved in cell wall biosynthesis